MNAFVTDQFALPLPDGHTFPVVKYARLRERVVAEGLVAPDELIVPAAATDEQLHRVHDLDYVRRVAAGSLSAAEVRALGLPWSREMVERSRRSVGGTIAAARAAPGAGVAVNLAGGTHHAFRDRGAGYCVFSDAAVAARVLQDEGRVRRVVILDCDVHQGDGTATIFADDPTVFTLSIHGARNYPLRKQRSDLDLELPDRADDAMYLDAVERGVRAALGRAGADLAIYLAGADPYEGDRLGRLAVTKAGLAARDRLVFGLCAATGLPVAVAMAGGYARRIDDTVEIHLQTVREAARHARR